MHSKLRARCSLVPFGAGTEQAVEVSRPGTHQIGKRARDPAAQLRAQINQGSTDSDRNNLVPTSSSTKKRFPVFQSNMTGSMIGLER